MFYECNVDLRAVIGTKGHYVVQGYRFTLGQPCNISTCQIIDLVSYSSQSRGCGSAAASGTAIYIKGRFIVECIPYLIYKISGIPVYVDCILKMSLFILRLCPDINDPDVIRAVQRF